MAIETWSFYTLHYSLIALVLLLVLVVIAKRYGWRKALRLSKVGVVITLLISVVSLADLFNKDWSIPECRDESGKLIEENPKCSFP